MLVNLTRRAQLQIQGLNLNNAVFGFYVGDPGAAYSIQREVYGRSFIVGMKLRGSERGERKAERLNGSCSDVEIVQTQTRLFLSRPE